MVYSLVESARPRETNMKPHLQHRPFARPLALLLFALALLLAATIAAAFTHEAESEAARRNTGLRPLVLVAGASGSTGQHIARRARAEGYAVRATSRDVPTARRNVPGDFEWVQLDVRDGRAVREATRNIEYVICAVTAQTPEGPEGPQFIDYRGVVNLIDAAVAARVRHFVLISSASAGTHRDQTKQPRYGFALLWKTKAEEHLKASGLSYTIVGAASLREGSTASLGLRAVPRDRYTMASVARDDVARVAIDALRNPAARGKTFALFNDPSSSSQAWRKELDQLDRDPGAAQPSRQVTAGSREPDRNVSPITRTRFVPPTPSRERLMIEEGSGGEEAPRVGWTQESAAR
jgi:uncharacterized protein YbjT (DUF2867 family)